MKVYLLMRETYDSCNNDYDATVKAFIDKQSAMNYLAIEKESMMQEAMEVHGFATIEELQHSEITIDYENRIDHYYVNIEDWGYDYLTILEQDLMSFNI